MDATSHRRIFRYDPRWGYWFNKNLLARVIHERGGYYVETNADGARSSRPFGPKRPGVTRVLVVGDSFSAADGVDNAERWSDRLEALHADVEVCNVALPGSGTDQQLLVHEAFAPAIDPDVLVLAPLAENIRRVVAAFRPMEEGRTGRSLLVPKPYFTLDRGELVPHHQPVPRPFAGDAPPGAAVDVGGRFAAARRLVNEIAPGLKPLAFRLTRYQPHPEYDDPGGPAFRLMAALIERIFAASRAAVKVLMVLPYYVHVEGLAAPNYVAPFRALAEALGVLFVDPLPRFSALPRALRRGCRYAHDIHYTPLAHGVVAAALGEALRGRGVLRPRPA
jgi:carbamoyltransferase